jgi:hypothetical protein
MVAAEVVVEMFEMCLEKGLQLLQEAILITEITINV